MGIDYRTYIGPYVRCRVGTVEVTHQRRTCTNAACPENQRNHMSATFCSLCGSRVGIVEHTATEDAVNDVDVVEAIDESLMPASGDAYHEWSRENRTHVWTANVGTPGRDYRLEEYTSFALVEITPDQVREELAQFEEQFAKELAIFRELYGADAVTTGWGIVQDYS